jgi:hypothetical protein
MAQRRRIIWLRTDGLFATLCVVGGPLSYLAALRFIPRPIRDSAYACVAACGTAGRGDADEHRISVNRRRACAQKVHRLPMSLMACRYPQVPAARAGNDRGRTRPSARDQFGVMERTASVGGVMQ